MRVESIAKRICKGKPDGAMIMELAYIRALRMSLRRYIVNTPATEA